MKMKTPIVDFIEEYKRKKPLRLHTPGHKGSVFCGFEADDITETDGADELFSPHGIIACSEKNASRLFGCPTYYSAEGSSLCVRAMVFMLTERLGRPAKILAGRNAHRSFIIAAAMTDARVSWIAPHPGDGYVSVSVTAEDIENAVELPDAVYITTPDYLGKMTDIRPISAVCRRLGIYLLVDSAHGAYLHFLKEPADPITQGADVCCTSAHKTLPALTGAAYLHTSVFTEDEVRTALSAFASTSPSYLILESLDRLNAYLEGYPRALSRFITHADAAKKALSSQGWRLYGDEPLKITLFSGSRGYTGDSVASYLTGLGIYPEFHDAEAITFMITPQTGARGLSRLVKALGALPAREPVESKRPEPYIPERVLGIREAFFSQKETLPTRECEGRICCDANIGCPPAVSPVVCGELIDAKCVRILLACGIERCTVVRPRPDLSSPAESQAASDPSCTL